MKQALLIVGLLVSAAVACGQLDNVSVNHIAFIGGLVGMLICGGLLTECGLK